MKSQWKRAAGAAALGVLAFVGASCALAMAEDESEASWNDEDLLGDEQINVCGDGLANGMEECDDGNLVDGDGCFSTCVLEFGWDCAGQPSVCAVVGRAEAVDPD